jgi:hypothetical protein
VWHCIPRLGCGVRAADSTPQILPAVIRVMLESQMPSGIVTFIFLVQYCEYLMTLESSDATS